MIREQEEVARKTEAYCKEYPDRLMNVLRRATEHGLGITVTEENVFFVSGTGTGYGYLLPYCIVGTTWHARLEELTFLLNQKDEELKEKLRKNNLRLAALSKLSAEEKEVLGL